MKSGVYVVGRVIDHSLSLSARAGKGHYQFDPAAVSGSGADSLVGDFRIFVEELWWRRHRLSFRKPALPALGAQRGEAIVIASSLVQNALGEGVSEQQSTNRRASGALRKPNATTGAPREVRCSRLGKRPCEASNFDDLYASVL
jgi:hypothetical protein